MAEHRRIAVSILSGSAGRIAVADILDPQVFEPHVIRELFDELLSVVQSSSTNNLLIDLSLVQYVSSGVLNRLIDLKDHIAAAGGRLRLCGLSAEVAEIFKITQLNRQFDIAPDQAAALASF
jgi:anti-sigma B factor antagonist